MTDADLDAAVQLTVPPLEGWTVRERRTDRCVLGHRSGAVATVSAQIVAVPCDPRAVAARLAAAVREHRSAVEVHLRRWGTFGDRRAAIQILGLGNATQLHGITGTGVADDPLVMVVVVGDAGVATLVGPSFAALVAESTARVLP